MSAIEGLVHDYGYFFILIGTYFDHYGIPLFLVFGGIAASQNLLNVLGVLACGFAGGWIADLFLYFLGYKTGIQYWMQFSFVRKLSGAIELIDHMFRTRPATMVILGRFLFAVSKLIPPFAGMIRYHVRNYVLYSLIGNILFSITYTVTSFYLGNWILDSQKGLKASNLVLTLILVGSMVFLTKKFRKKSS